MIVGLRCWVGNQRLLFLNHEKSRSLTLILLSLSLVILCCNSKNWEKCVHDLSKKNNRALCSAHICIWVPTGWCQSFVMKYLVFSITGQRQIGFSCERVHNRTGNQNSNSLERKVSASTETTLKDHFLEITSVNKLSWRKASEREQGTDGLYLRSVSHLQTLQRSFSMEILLIAYQTDSDWPLVNLSSPHGVYVTIKLVNICKNLK